MIHPMPVLDLPLYLLFFLINVVLSASVDVDPDAFKETPLSLHFQETLFMDAASLTPDSR